MGPRSELNRLSRFIPRRWVKLPKQGSLSEPAMAKDLPDALLSVEVRNDDCDSNAFVQWAILWHGEAACVWGI